MILSRLTEQHGCSYQDLNGVLEAATNFQAAVRKKHDKRKRKFMDEHRLTKRVRGSSSSSSSSSSSITDSNDFQIVPDEENDDEL